MRQRLRVLAVVGMVVLLTGCCMKHEWKEATCTEPKKCVKCGETEGEPLGHTWAEATCTKPKTCTVCGATEGEPLGHTWVDRTTEAPKTCSRCGETEGKPITCTTMDMTKFLKSIADDMKNILFMKNSFGSVSVKDNVLHFYDFDQNEIKTVGGNPDDTEGKAVHITDNAGGNNGEKSFYVYTSVDAEGNCTIRFFADRGEETGTLQTKVDIPAGHRVESRNIIESRYILFADTTATHNARENKTLFCIDYETMSFVDPSTVDPPKWYVKEKFARLWDQKNAPEKYCFAMSPDESKCLIVDYKYYSVKGEYKEFADFNTAGYALVSEDGKTYDLIDLNLKVVGKNVLEARYVTWIGENAYLVQPMEGPFRIVIIE